MNGWTNPLCCSQHRFGPGDDFLSLIGLFYRASQRPWQLQQWLSLACFHYKPWHLISLREMASERWGTRVAKPFFSALDDTLCLSHWCEKCLCVPAPHPSCFCPFCHLLKTHRFEFFEFLMHLPPPPSPCSLNLGNSNQVWKKPVNLLWMTTTQSTAGGSWKVGASHKSERYTSVRYAIYVRNTDLSQLYQSSTVWNQLKQGQSIKVNCSSLRLPEALPLLVKEWKGAKIKTFHKHINWLLKAGQVAPPLHSNSPLQLWGQAKKALIFLKKLNT